MGEENKVVAIGFFENPHSKEADAFKTAADSIEDVVFGITSNPEIANLYNVIDTSTVVLFKKFDEGRNELEGDVTVESVKSFVAKSYLPLVVDFNTETAKAIFQGSVKKHFIIFSSAKEEKFEYFIHDARKVAADYKGDVMFVTVTTDEDEHKRVVDFFGITDKELPTFRGFPTIKLFSSDNTVRDYSGSRTLEDLVKFLKPPAEEAEEAVEMGEVKDEL